MFLYGDKEDYEDWSSNFGYERIKEASQYLREFMKVTTNYKTDLSSKMIKDIRFINNDLEMLGNSDFLNGKLEGVGYQEMYFDLPSKENNYNGKRNSMYQRLVVPLFDKNVKILTFHEALSISFKKEDHLYKPEYVNVKNKRDNEILQIYCKNEIIICSGVFGSVELLYNSGNF